MNSPSKMIGDTAAIETPTTMTSPFGNYKRLIFQSQTGDEGLLQAARAAANRLMLKFEHIHCGYGELQAGLQARLEVGKHGQKNIDLLA